MNEAERQQLLLARLAGGADTVGLPLREVGARAACGLAAYRANGDAIADRSLAAACGTVRAMVGAELFTRLAHEFRRVSPPVRGDLGEWGDAFPAWLASHAGLREWPWLGDSARLDLALHRSERAADDTLDTASLQLLETEDPATLQLLLVPGTEPIESTWPIATIHAAHQLSGASAESTFERIRTALAAGQGEQVLVARCGWRGVVHRLDPATFRWLAGVSAGAHLADALVAAGNGFDCADWLATAMQQGWLNSIRRLDD